MAVPTIHLNGTNPDRLIDDLCTASNALDAAYQALKVTSPNGRDYYLQGADALNEAEREHRSRLSRVDQVKNEIDELALAICRAKDSASPILKHLRTPQAESSREEN